MPKRTKRVYISLLIGWALVCLWQIFDHHRVKQSAREALLSRARDISYSVSVVIRSLGHFGIISQTRLEAALQELAKSGELQTVALLNSSGEVVALAGEPMELEIENLPESGAQWRKKSVMFINLVDLGLATRDGITTRTTPIIIRRPEPPKPPSNDDDTITTPPPPPPTRSEGRERFDRDFSRRRERPRNFGRPPWMTEEQYKEILEKQGLHGFVMQMSITSYLSEITRDFWLRLTLIGIATLALIGLWLAWRTIERSQMLQMRLIKAQEMNVHLKEMNIAAAGLAHETKNPLNIVRGQAQIISRDPAASDETRRKANDIMLEVDRVTSRLTEFINYSKPLAPRPAATKILDVVRDVERTLATDIEDKSITVETKGPELTIEADESLLRQVLFNLILNAIQAVDKNGAVTITLQHVSQREAALEVSDNGAGVPAEARQDIFRPYFTTRKEGLGFGLAIVRQIVLAHHWEISYSQGERKGSIFRISGIKIIQ